MGDIKRDVGWVDMERKTKVLLAMIPHSIQLQFFLSSRYNLIKHVRHISSQIPQTRAVNIFLGTEFFAQVGGFMYLVHFRR